MKMLSKSPVQRRKYVRKKIAKNIADDDTVIKPDAKKRGRKRGRKKKDQDLTFKAEDVLDFMIRNYPQMGIERIRENVIEGLRTMNELGDSPYRLYRFTYNDNTCYYDDKGAILNADGKIIGYFVKQYDGTNKMYLFEHKNKDTRSFAEVIESIEGKNNLK